MMKKYCFNMIEIILAISIIAIGLSSVMALFISGIRTGNDTVISSNMPDVSESLLNHIRAEIDKCRSENGWDGDKLAKIAPTTPGDPKFSDKLAEGSNGDVITGDNSGNFLYRQLSVSAVDASGKPTSYVPSFAAIASVKTVSRPVGDIVMTDPSDLKGAQFANTAALKDAEGTTLDTGLMNKFRRVVQVTISYPADSATKESKTYVMEFFNDRYDRFNREKEDATPTP